MLAPATGCLPTLTVILVASARHRRWHRALRSPLLYLRRGGGECASARRNIVSGSGIFGGPPKRQNPEIPNESSNHQTKLAPQTCHLMLIHDMYTLINRIRLLLMPCCNLLQIKSSNQQGVGSRFFEVPHDDPRKFLRLRLLSILHSWRTGHSRLLFGTDRLLRNQQGNFRHR